MTRAIDTTVVPGSRLCTKCGRAKPQCQFYASHPWCKNCIRLSQVGSYGRLTEEAKRKKREAGAKYRAANPEKVLGWKKAWLRTEAGKLRHRLYWTRHRLRRNPTDTLRESEAILLADLERITGAEA